MTWSRQILRSAVLRQVPSGDVLRPDAHRHCRFGRWFDGVRARFEQLDAATTRQVQQAHEDMHAAVRALCIDLTQGRTGQARHLDQFESTQTALVAGLSSLKTQVIRAEAQRDALTGLPLRHGLAEVFSQNLHLATRANRHLVVLMLDLDHFKHVNDLHGHQAGDAALRHVAGVLTQHARKGESMFRYGGEEFLAFLQVRQLDEAALAAERLLCALRSTPLQLEAGVHLALRMSAGLTVADVGEPLTTAIARADKALYAAKHGGRDRWAWYELQTGTGTNHQHPSMWSQRASLQ